MWIFCGTLDVVPETVATSVTIASFFTGLLVVMTAVMVCVLFGSVANAGIVNRASEWLIVVNVDTFAVVTALCGTP